MEIILRILIAIIVIVSVTKRFGIFQSISNPNMDALEKLVDTEEEEYDAILRESELNQQDTPDVGSAKRRTRKDNDVFSEIVEGE